MTVKTITIEWSKSPTRAQTELGLRRRWLTRDRSYQIVQYPTATGRYIAAALPNRLLGDFRSLQAAKRACLSDQKAR